MLILEALAETLATLRVTLQDIGSTREGGDPELGLPLEVAAVFVERTTGSPTRGSDSLAGGI